MHASRPDLLARVCYEHCMLWIMQISQGAGQHLSASEAGPSMAGSTTAVAEPPRRTVGFGVPRAGSFQDLSLRSSSFEGSSGSHFGSLQLPALRMAPSRPGSYDSEGTARGPAAGELLHAALQISCGTWQWETPVYLASHHQCFVCYSGEPSDASARFTARLCKEAPGLNVPVNCCRRGDECGDGCSSHGRALLVQQHLGQRRHWRAERLPGDVAPDERCKGADWCDA